MLASNAVIGSARFTSPALLSLLFVACAGGPAPVPAVAGPLPPAVTASPSPPPPPPVPSTPRVLASKPGFVGSGLASDGRFVYFSFEKKILRVPRDGGSPDELAQAVMAVEDRADDIAVADGEVFWLAWGNGYASLNRGDTGLASFSFPEGRDFEHHHALAVSDGVAYVALPNGVFSVPAKGASPTVRKLSDRPSCGVAVRGARVYVRSRARGKDGFVVSIDRDGRGEVVLAEDHYGPCAIAVDAARVYWGNFDASASAPQKILAAPLGGGPAVVLDDTGDVALSDLAVGGTDLYWVGYGRKVVRVPLAGGRPATIAEGHWGAASVAVDDLRVYWTLHERAGGQWRGGVFFVPR